MADTPKLVTAEDVERLLSSTYFDGDDSRRILRSWHAALPSASPSASGEPGAWPSDVSRTCGVWLSNGHSCGEPTTHYYPTMDGRAMALCIDHAQKHSPYAISVAFPTSAPSPVEDVEIQPCPFCGNTKFLGNAMGNDGGGWYTGCVRCQVFARCDCSDARRAQSTCETNWNRRPPFPPSAPSPSEPSMTTNRCSKQRSDMTPCVLVDGDVYFNDLDVVGKRVSKWVDGPSGRWLSTTHTVIKKGPATHDRCVGCGRYRAAIEEEAKSRTSKEP